MNRAHKSKVRPPDSRNVYRHVRIPPAAVSDPNHHPLQVLSATRLRRAPSGDKLDDFLEKMEAISRIFTAISLELGLINGSIDINKVLPELLHMGNVTVAELTAIDETKVNAAMTEMGGLSGKLRSGDEITKVEKRIELLENLRKAAASFGDLENLNGQDKYKAKIATLIGIETDFTESLVNKFSNSVTAFLDNWNKVENFETEFQNSSEGEKTSFMGALRTSITSLITDSVNLKDSIAKLEAVRQHGVSFIQPLLDESKVRNGFDVSTGLTTDNAGKQNLNTLVGSSQTFQNAEGSMKTIQNVINFRKIEKMWKFENTAGFPRGVDDMFKIDASNEWVRKKMGKDAQKTVEGLKKAFDLMNGLKKDVREMDDEFISVNPREVETVNHVLAAQQDISKLSQNQVNVVDKITNCDEGRPTELPTDSDKTAAIGAIIELDSTLNKLTFMKDFDKITSLQEFKDAANFKSNTVSEHPAEIPGMLATLRGLEEAKTTVSICKSIEQSVGVLKALPKKIKTMISNINKSLETGISTYQTALRDKNVLKLYDCLKAVGDDAALVGSIMNQMEKIRQLSSSSKLKEAKTGVNAVLNSKRHVVTIQGNGGKLKSVKMAEIDAMISLMPKPKVNSQKLGMAVQGIRRIREAEKNQTTLNALWEQIDKIKTAANTNQNSLTAKQHSDLLSMEELGTKLKAMFGQIDNFRKSLENLSDSNLADYSNVFKAASDTVTPVIVDAKSLIVAVKRLAELDSTIPSPLLISTLETLDTLDLNFASYEIKEAKESLENMDKFLLEYASKVSKINTISTSAPSDFSTTALPPTPDGEEANYTMAIVGGAAGLLVVVGVVVAVLLWFCRKKKGDEKPPEQNPIPGDGGGEDEPPVQLYEPNIEVDRPRFQKNKFFAKNAAALAKPPPKVHVEYLPDTEERKLDKTQSFIVSNEEVFQFISNYLQEILKKFNKNRAVLGAVTVREYNEMNHTFPSNAMFGKYGPANERRTQNQYCREETAVTVTGFSNSFIHANRMEIDGCTWIMCQAPLDGTINNCVSTLEKHWAMICQQNVKVISQLCNFKEDGEDKCARYYAEEAGSMMNFGKYDVKTTRHLDVKGRFTFNEHYKCFDLECTDKQTGKVHNVVLLRFVGWPDMDAPFEPEHGAEIVEFLESHNGTKIVHCSAGVGRTGVIVSIRMGIEKVLKGTGSKLPHFMGPVRACRLHAVKNGIQTFYILMAMGKALMTYRNVELEDYEKLMHIWDLVYHEKVKQTGDTDCYECAGKAKEDEPEVTVQERALLARDKKLLNEGIERIEKKWVEKRKRQEEEAAEVLRQAGVEGKKKKEPSKKEEKKTLSKKEQKKSSSKKVTEPKKEPSKKDVKSGEQKPVSKEEMKVEQKPAEQKPEEKKPVEQKPVEPEKPSTPSKEEQKVEQKPEEPKASKEEPKDPQVEKKPEEQK